MSRSKLARLGQPTQMRLTLCGLLFLSLLVLFVNRANAYSNLYAFGDSLSDSGNVFAANGVPIAPYFNGRFSNGPVWVETLADNLGLSADASLLGGTNYAFGGATTGTPPGSSTPTLTDQMGLYLTASGGIADPDALYVVFGGGNDVRAQDLSNSVSNISNIVTTLAGAGATTFLIPNLPDIGKTPEALVDPTLSAGATALSSVFNAQLDVAIDNLRINLGANIFELDTFGFLNGIIADPTSAGITNVDTPCFSTQAMTVCDNPDEYVFWDSIHPTAEGHRLLGEAATATLVPVPAAAWLFASAIAVLGWARRRTNTAI